jgi:hypothetical protein
MRVKFWTLLNLVGLMLLQLQELGGDWQQFEALCKEAVRRVITMGAAEDVHHDMQ